jgi:hypothetical protein
VSPYSRTAALPHPLFAIAILPRLAQSKRPRDSDNDQDVVIKRRRDVVERRWTVNGAIRETDLDGYYNLDLGTQQATRTCLDHVQRRKFVLLVGARASGKTTRLFRLQAKIAHVGFLAL